MADKFSKKFLLTSQFFLGDRTMKKILTLVLVLALASLTNAAQVWTITGSTATQTGAAGWEVNPGDAVTLALSSDSTTAAGVNIDLLTDNGAAGSFTAISLNALFNVGDNRGMTGSALDAMLAGYGLPASGLNAGDLALIGVAVGGSMVAANNTIMTLNYTVGAGLGNITLNGVAIVVDPADATWQQGLNQIAFSSGNEAISPISLNVIPEPITMALLAVGGLFIRRKK
jgi:hypothetical protein